MKITVVSTVVVAWLILGNAGLVLAEQTTVVKTEPKDNVYLVDAMDWVDALDNWQPVGRTKITLAGSRKYRPLGKPCLNAKITASKAEQMVHGVQRTGLGLPLPKAIRFRVWADVPYLWVVLGDSAGRQVSSRIPIEGMESLSAVEIELPITKTVPMGVGAESIQDIDMVALLTRESAGEFPSSGVYDFYFGDLKAIYPQGVGPMNPPTFTRADLEKMLEPLGGEIEKIDELLANAKAAGIETRYPMVARTVLAYYRSEVFDMLKPEDGAVARRTAQFLLDCARRTQDELAGLIANPDTVRRIPNVSLQNLQWRDGSFFSGDRPVFMAGVCGWFRPGHFGHFVPMGYSCLSMDLGPESTVPTENCMTHEPIENAEKANVCIAMDYALENNIAVDLLLSPHYIPGWAWEKWPSMDVTSWRGRVNHFMRWTITDKHFREMIARHLSVYIPEIREHPALLSYDLINEAWYRLIPDFPAKQWQDFRKQHGELDEWQALSQMGTETVTEFIDWFITELHKYDKTRPVHMKTIDTREVLSVDREAIGDILTANGMDAMSSWPDWTGTFAADFIWLLLRHDFHRSLQPNHPIMDAEYHISDGLSPTPGTYFRSALWALSLHGRDLTSCWVFERVDTVSIYWHVTGVEQLGRCALDFIRLGPEIQAFQQQQRGPLAVYFGGTNIEEAYAACLFQDVNVGLVTDKRIRSGALDSYKVLVMPAGVDLPQDVQEKLQAFRQSDKRIVRCYFGISGEQLWRNLAKMLSAVRVAPQVRVGQWGVECRSIELDGRKLFYLLNHNRKPARVQCQSKWNLANAIDLITQEKLDARSLTLEPMQIRLIEVGNLQ